MNSKILIFVVVALSCFMQSSAGEVPFAPLAAAYVAPYASSYNAHYVNHAVSAPLVSAPLVSAPLTAAYTHYPYSAAYAAYPYSAPLVVAK